MTFNFPWHLSETARQRYLFLVVIPGSALASSPAIRAVFGDDALVSGALPPVACTLSTAMWTWAFVALLRRRFSPGHGLWLGPLFGALNAGTSLALVNLFAGDPAGQVLAGVMVGTFFGSFMGGGPLGLVFGVMIAGFVAYWRDLQRSTSHDVSLRLLRAGALWLGAVALLTVWVDARSRAPVGWPALALSLGAVAAAGHAFVVHAHAHRWVRRLRRDALADYALVSDGGVDTAFWRDRRQSGPFRSADLTHVIGPLPSRSVDVGVRQTALLLLLSAAFALLAS